jgi:hypothetical protein
MNTSTTGSTPARHQHMDEPHANLADTAWRPLYQVGGAAALLSVVFIAAAVVVFIVWPIPTTVEAWFARYHRNALIGLLDLDLLLVASYVAMVPLYLALYVALRRVSASFMAIALAFSLVGAALMLAVNPALAMLSLSNQYAAATTDAQRATLVAAGQALLTNWQGTGFDVAYFLGAVAVLIIAAVMLRSTIFSNAAAYAGLALGALTLIPATAGTVGVICSLLSLMPTVIWLILIARRLFQLAQGVDYVASRE